MYFSYHRFFLFSLGLEESLGIDNKFVKLNKLVDFEESRESMCKPCLKLSIQWFD
ncbi:hypothetical protein F7308_0271 [Francisella salina]|uniref:Uncharacterized protein n=1 Tax=Francisella salina TaxID=573569 RepID=A0ABM5M7R5_FRAST|nr:hypothetical protein F7308_0271 [Francisella salina]